MKFNKLNNNSGSAMLLVIFSLIIVSIIILSFSTQVGNQIKSTMNLDKDIQEKYDRESEIENSIGEFIEGINIIHNDENYYEVHYTKDISYKNVNISNNVNSVSDNGIVNIDDLSKGVTFTLEFIENDMNKKSIVEINVKNISGNKGSEKCETNYEVKHWRS